MVLSVPKPSKIPGSPSIRPPTLQHTVGSSPLIQMTAMLSTLAPLYLRLMVGLVYGCIPLFVCGSAARNCSLVLLLSCQHLFPSHPGLPDACSTAEGAGVWSPESKPHLILVFDRVRHLKLDISFKEVKNP